MMFEPQFDSLRELAWMNGHGPYVWASYGLALLAIIYLVWSPLAGRRRFLRQLRGSLRREQRAGQASRGRPAGSDNTR